MKKALQHSDASFLCIRNGKIEQRYFSVEDILSAVNGEVRREPLVARAYDALREWMRKYLESGCSDEFLDELNQSMKQIPVQRHVVPGDFFSATSDAPQCLYVPHFSQNDSPEAVAAHDFSKLITGGNLRRLKQCHSSECDNFFLGPPQSKWCSKRCGSSFRVKKKRKRDKE